MNKNFKKIANCTTTRLALKHIGKNLNEYCFNSTLDLVDLYQWRNVFGKITIVLVNVVCCKNCWGYFTQCRCWHSHWNNGKICLANSVKIDCSPDHFLNANRKFNSAFIRIHYYKCIANNLPQTIIWASNPRVKRHFTVCCPNGCQALWFPGSNAIDVS